MRSIAGADRLLPGLQPNNGRHLRRVWLRGHDHGITGGAGGTGAGFTAQLSINGVVVNPVAPFPRTAYFYEVSTTGGTYRTRLLLE